MSVSNERLQHPFLLISLICWYFESSPYASDITDFRYLQTSIVSRTTCAWVLTRNEKPKLDINCDGNCLMFGCNWHRRELRKKTGNRRYTNRITRIGKRTIEFRYRIYVSRSFFGDRCGRHSVDYVKTIFIDSHILIAWSQLPYILRHFVVDSSHPLLRDISRGELEFIGLNSPLTSDWVETFVYDVYSIPNEQIWCQGYIRFPGSE